MATTPVPAFIAPPDFPALSDRASGTYNGKAYAWADAMQATTGPNIHAIAVAVKDNADDAAANATLADADRVQTGLDRVATAADRVQTGLDRVQTGADRNAAEASAVQASKLNLGSKSSPPTLDNQGDALLAGATYYDTALNKWQVWDGSAWAQGLSAVAGVSSLNGLTGDVSGIATDAGLATKQATLVSGTNLKTINGASLLGSGDMVVGSGTYHNKLVTQSSTTFVVPAGTYKIRAYAGGKGGDGMVGSGATFRGAGSGGGFAFGDIATTPGESLTVNISAGVAKVSRGATDLLTANPGINGSSTGNVAGGTASIDVSVSNGAAYSGGIGIGNVQAFPGGGSAGSPLGNGFAGSTNGGGGGIGGVGASAGGGAGGAAAGAASGGAGGAAVSMTIAGAGRAIPFSDPLLAHCVSGGLITSVSDVAVQAGPGAGGSSGSSGGFGGGGGFSSAGRGGWGGELGGGGGGNGVAGGSSLACGGGGASTTVGGVGGPATVWIFY